MAKAVSIYGRAVICGPGRSLFVAGRSLFSAGQENLCPFYVKLAWFSVISVPRYEKIKSMVKRCKLYLEYKRLEYELISVPFRQDQLCGFHDATGDVNNLINVSMGFLGIVSAYS